MTYEWMIRHARAGTGRVVDSISFISMYDTLRMRMHVRVRVEESKALHKPHKHV